MRGRHPAQSSGKATEMTILHANILPATVEDAAALLALQKQAFFSDIARYGDPAIPPMLQTVEDTARDVASMRCWKAVHNGRITGSIRARETSGAVDIYKLIVLPDNWGKGLGSSLLRTVEAAFPDVHLFRLFTGGLNYDNQRFYLRRGYRIVDRRQITPTVFIFDLEKPGPRPLPSDPLRQKVQALEISPAAIHDAEAIQTLQRLAFWQEAVQFDDLGMQPLRQTPAEIAGDIASARVWKATGQGVIVGSVRARPASDGGVDIFKLLVHPRLWGGRLGTRLLRTAEAAFPQATVFRLYTAERNSANVAFYHKHGYQVAGGHSISPTLRMVDLHKVPPASGPEGEQSSPDIS